MMMMMKSSSTFLILVHILMIQLMATTISVSQHNIGFFKFVQQWPPAFPSQKQKCSQPKPAVDFGIHGLWPAYPNGTSLLECDPNNPFDPSSIKGFKGDMQRHWPDLTCGPPTSFWAHEWVKHGTCSGFTQTKYFQSSLDLKKNKVNLLGILKNAGIKPGVGGIYNSKDIIVAIRKATSHEPEEIQCNLKNELYQIFMCIEVLGKDLTPCTGQLKVKCKDSTQIKFP